MSRGRLLTHVIDEDHSVPFSVISIYGKWSEDVALTREQIQLGCRLASFKFEDRTTGNGLITSHQALDILRFAGNTIDSGRNLFIHCELGKSRSAACGIVIGQLCEIPVVFCEYNYIELSGDSLLKYKDYGIEPNTYVMDTLFAQRIPLENACYCNRKKNSR